MGTMGTSVSQRHRDTDARGSRVWAALLALLLAAGCTVRADLSLDLPGTDAAAGDALASLDLRGPSDAVRRDTFVLLPFDAVVLHPEVKIPDVADAGDAADAARDTFVRPDLVAPRYCPWEIATLPLVTSSQVFWGESFFEASSRSSPVDRVCDDGLFPGRDNPERVFLVHLDRDAEIFVRTRCYGWDCDAILVRDDCLSSNVEACLTTDGDERRGVTVGPGLYYLVLEAHTGFEPAPFDLQIAVSPLEGPDPCPVAGTFRLSALDAFSDCTVRDGEGWREITVRGDTSSDTARDDVFSRCVGPSIHTDTVGGAPELVWRIVADRADGVTRTLEATLEPDDASWDPVLSITGAPCGGDDAMIDCDYQPFGTTRVSDLTLFDGDELYVVVEGMGERALDGEASGPFALTLRVSDPDCVAE